MRHCRAGGADEGAERGELGIEPEELSGSPSVAAVLSFLPFVVGAVVPVAPYALLDGTP
jgi:VIT1/CCC1 family predicted Fe2+/Mn2+ transporter